MKEKIDLVTLPKKSFWTLSLPIIAFCIFDAIYGIVDMLWVSKISMEAFYAMGISIPFVTFVFSVGDSIGQGTNSIMSRFIGAGDYESSYNALIHGLLACNLAWFIIVLLFLFANGVLFYVDAENSYILIFDYLVPIIVFAYLFIFNNLFSETLQAEGNSRTPTALIIGSNILNLILDPIFIFNLNMGIKGAAYATVFSAFVVFIPILYLYLSGRTKVPLSPKYFKFRSYIIIEIFKVALPNFLDNALWLLSASYVNATLLIFMNNIGPILYSVSNKLKNLLIVPVRGYGRALMSVTGHLFGARKFNELNDMYKYVLKLSVFTSLALVILFFFMRDYIFNLFSITGMQTEIYWIALFGIVSMLAVPFSMISAKMLDGFGKSMYSLLFTAVKIFFEMGLIIVLNVTLNNASSVLISIVITEVGIGVVYYLFLRHLFKNFDKKYDGKSTVKTFTKEDQSIDEIKLEGEDDGSVLKRKLFLFTLILLVIATLLILYLIIKLHPNSIVLIGIVAIICISIGSFLRRRVNLMKLHIIEVIILTVVFYLLLNHTSYVTTVLLIVISMLLLYIMSTLHKLTEKVKS